MKSAQVAAAAEQAACEAHFVQASGRGKFACSLPGASAGIDASTLMQEFQDGMAGKDAAKANAALQRTDAALGFELQQACTKGCLERGPNLLGAATQGPSLVANYKRCMVVADSTPEARKLNAYETELYCDYLTKAAAKCRAAHRCDWVENFSDLQCSYVSPGVGVCNR